MSDTNRTPAPGSLSDAFVATLRAKMPDGASLAIPPPCFEEMEAEVVDVDPEAGRLVVRFPNPERYQNPVGFMQGGMIAAALDNVFGPLTYLMGDAALTTNLQVSYVQPVTPDLDAIVVEATVAQKAPPHLFLDGRVMNEARDTLFAVGHAQFRATAKAAMRRV